MSAAPIITLVIAILIFFYIVSIYNKLVSLKNRIQNAFSQIEVQLKRRYDLIPNLVEIAKTYLKHERETLEAVVHARNTAVAGLKSAAADPSSSNAIRELAGAESILTSALNKFNVVVEAYPDLKASDTMIQLNEELGSTENRIAFSRQAFNDAATEYNTFRQSFPTFIFTGVFGHLHDAELLEFSDSNKMQDAPKVSF